MQTGLTWGKGREREERVWRGETERCRERKR